MHPFIGVSWLGHVRGTCRTARGFTTLHNNLSTRSQAFDGNTSSGDGIRDYALIKYAKGTLSAAIPPLPFVRAPPEKCNYEVTYPCPYLASLSHIAYPQQLRLLHLQFSKTIRRDGIPIPIPSPQHTRLPASRRCPFWYWRVWEYLPNHAFETS